VYLRMTSSDREAMSKCSTDRVVFAHVEAESAQIDNWEAQSVVWSGSR
jgi:hypothetical protein